MSVTGKRLIFTDADFADISVSDTHYTLNSIAITTQPTKQTYTIGEAFDTTGMVVTATMTEDTTHEVITRPVTGYTYEPSDTFTTTGSKTITVSYVKGGITKTTTTTITVTSGTIYTVTGSITNGTLAGASSIAQGGTATANITPSTGYRYPDSVTVVGATSSYSAATGTVELSNPTGNVTVTGTCLQGGATENLTLRNGAYTKTTSTLSPETAIRAYYLKNVHAGDTMRISPNVKAGSDYQFLLCLLTGTSGHTWAGEATEVATLGSEKLSYNAASYTFPVDCRIVAVVINMNDKTTNIPTSELGSLLQMTWANPTGNDPVSDVS